MSQIACLAPEVELGRERCPWDWNWGHGILAGSAAETVPKKDGERESGGWRLGLSEVAARQDVWPRPLREKVGLARGDGRLERGPPPARCNHLSQFVAMASKTTSQRRIPGRAEIMKKVPLSNTTSIQQNFPKVSTHASTACISFLLCKKVISP